MPIPNLAGVITKDDVFRKGSGSYAADYVSWARIANHLHTHAPGWEFVIKPAPDGGHVWKAPDGTGYIVTYFTGPDGEATPDFPYPCQDHRNLPIAFEQISCRTLTDSHRRALCANAAFAMSLGYELWAREEVEGASTDAPAAHAAPKPTTASKPVKKAAPAVAQDPAETPLSDRDRKTLITTVTAADPDVRSRVVSAFKAQFGTPADQPILDYIKTQAHFEFLMQQLKETAPVA